MIVQACLNGGRSPRYHPMLPATADAMARDGAACVMAGAAELHIHPRADEGQESLAAVDPTVEAVRNACPGTLVGVSTGAWIEGSGSRTRAAIASWRQLPDYASVNLSEPDAPAIMESLERRRVGIEAGLASVTDADRFLTLPQAPYVFRVLIELEEQDPAAARALADQIARAVADAGWRRPILVHGCEATDWALVDLARQRRWSTRVGREDGNQLPTGAMAPSNAALVTAAVRLLRRTDADDR